MDEDGRECLALLLGPLRDLAVGLTSRGLWMVDMVDERTVRFRDGAGKVTQKVVAPGTDAFRSAQAVSPEGTRLAVAWQGLPIGVYDTSSGEEQARCAGHTDRITALAFSPDGTRLASASDDFTARL
jgi:WD40 repeat protein